MFAAGSLAHGLKVGKKFFPLYPFDRRAIIHVIFAVVTGGGDIVNISSIICSNLSSVSSLAIDINFSTIGGKLTRFSVTG